MFLKWYFLDFPREIAQEFWEYFKILSQTFSITFLLRTFFYPWKRVIESYGKSFDLKRYFSVLIDNIVSRSVGMLIRTIVIILCLIIYLTWVIFLIISLLIWLLYPVLIYYSIQISIHNAPLIKWFIVAINILILSSIFYSYKYWRKNNLKIPKNLAEYLARYGVQREDIFTPKATNWIIDSWRIGNKAMLTPAEFWQFIQGTDFFHLFIKRANLDTEKLLLVVKQSVQKKDYQLLFWTNFKKFSIVRNKIDLADIFSILLTSNQDLVRFCEDNNLDSLDIFNLSHWIQKYLREEAIKRNKISPTSLRKHVRPIGLSLIYGWTPILDRFTIDLSNNPIIKNDIQLTSSQIEIIQQVIRSLSRQREANVLLIGEPGVGKKTIVSFLNKLSQQGIISPRINYHRIILLRASNLIGSFSSPINLENNLIRILNSANRAGNIILFIEDFNNLINKNNVSMGSINASAILEPYLNSNLHFICAISPGEYHSNIENQGELNNFFEKIQVKEPSQNEVLTILENKIPIYEKESRKQSTKIFFTYQAINKIIKLAGQYIHSEPFPEKAIDLVENLASYAQQKIVTGNNKNGQIISEKDVIYVVEKKTGIPIGQIQSQERNKLLNLEVLIHQRIVGQDEAVDAIARAIRRSRAKIRNQKRPIGSFLFLGPTGVGKTETAKALADIYFESKEKIIRLDMSEYQEINSIKRLLGPLPGESDFDEGGVFSRLITDNPFGLLLLDEFEKAHPKILNLFLQILDEGWLTDNRGTKLDFRNLIIIATSNAGAEKIRQTVLAGKSLSVEKEKIINQILEQGIFRPELINRFDELVFFKPLNSQHLIKIARLMLNNLAKRIMDNHGIYCQFSQDLVEKIAELGYDPEFGARPMKRVIQDKVETYLAQQIIADRLQRGDSINLTSQIIK